MVTFFIVTFNAQRTLPYYHTSTLKISADLSRVVLRLRKCNGLFTTPIAWTIIITITSDRVLQKHKSQKIQSVLLFAIRIEIIEMSIVSQWLSKNKFAGVKRPPDQILLQLKWQEAPHCAHL